MKKTGSLFRMMVVFSLLMIITACSPQAGTAGSAPTSPAAPTAGTYTDPFAYCAAAGTVDAPDGRYSGAEVPDEIITGFKKAAGLEDSTMPVEMFKKSTIWRCMENKVYACNFGANLPCDTKANTDKMPTREMADYCKTVKGFSGIPAYVTGHDTIYTWQCLNGVPAVQKQVDTADAAGFLTRIWYPIEPVP